MAPSIPDPPSAGDPSAGLYLIGRKEYLDFPEWGLRRVRVKIDTGARTSALDVAGCQIETVGGGSVARLRLALYPRRPARDRRVGGVRPVKTVTLYGRPDCHLCDEARAALERVRATHPFRLDEIDIEGDDELLKRYLERIPVVVLDGRELFEFFVDEERLRERL